MKAIEVYEPGSECMVDGEIPATITAVCIRPAEGGMKLLYEVTWWDERSRKTDWLEPFEVKPRDGKHAQIAFKPF